MVRPLHDPELNGAQLLPFLDVPRQGLRGAVAVMLPLHDGERPGDPVQEIEGMVLHREPERDEALHTRIGQRPLKADPRAEGESGAPELVSPRALARECRRGRYVPDLFIPAREGALALADPAKIEAQRGMTRRVEDQVDGVHDLAVHGAPVSGMRM